MKRLTFILIILSNLSGPLFSCTIFNATRGDYTLVGNNEDYWLDAYIWFLPSRNGEYGRITFGWSNGWSQGGVNDQGLFFDWASLSANDWKESPNMQPYSGLLVRGANQICELMLAACSTVDQAVDIFMTYNNPDFAHSHIMIVDKSGKSAVVEWWDGQMRVVYKTGSYQVLSNFTLTPYQNSSITPCARYNTAKTMLDSSTTISIGLFRDILDAVHQDAPGAYTVYSNIYDLQNGNIYLYHKSDFAHPMVLNVQEELKKGERTFLVKNIFSDPSLLKTSSKPAFNPKSSLYVFQDETGNIQVHLPENGPEDGRVEIFDLTGRMILREENAGTILVIPRGMLPSGVCLLRMTRPGRDETVIKFINLN